MSDQGVNTGSRNATYEQFAIFCVGNDIARESAFRAFCADACIGYKSLFGSYKGEVERSFIMNRRHDDVIMEFSKKEDSILLLDAAKNFGGGKLLRPASLLYRQDNYVLPLGYFTEVGRDVALLHSAWTFDPTTGKYWICKP